MPLNPRQQGLGFLLNQSARKLRSRLSDELRRHGLDDETYIVLVNVASADRATSALPTPRSIAESLHMPADSIVEAVARLERDGWLAPDRDGGPDDAALRLTPKATAVLPGFRDIGHWTLESALNGFTAAEIAQLEELLSRLLRNLG